MRQWDQMLARAFRSDDLAVVRDIHLQRARRAGVLADLAGQSPAEGLRLVLNLERSEDRRTRFWKCASTAGFVPQRQVAVDAAAPEFDPTTRTHWAPAGALREQAARNPANLACFLGHRAMWLRLLDSDQPCAAIYEDDAEPLGDPLRYLAAFPPPEDWDLISFSERAEPLDDLGRGYVPLHQAFSSHFRRADLLEYIVAPGSDSYLISRNGAGRLLALFSTVGLPAALDYVIVRNALAAPVVTGDARYDDRYNGIGAEGGGRAEAPPLRAFATSVALSEVGGFPSIMGPMRKKLQSEKGSGQ